MEEFAKRITFNTTIVNQDFNIVELKLGDADEEVINNFISYVIDKRQLLFLNEYSYELIDSMSNDKKNSELERIIDKCFCDYIIFNITNNELFDYPKEIKNDGLPGELFVTNIISANAKYKNVIPKIKLNYKKGGFTGIDVVANDSDTYIFSEVKYSVSEKYYFSSLAKDLQAILDKKMKEELVLIYQNNYHMKNGFDFMPISIEERSTITFEEIMHSKFNKNVKIILWGITEPEFKNSKKTKEYNQLTELIVELKKKYNHFQTLSIFYVHVPIVSKKLVTERLLCKLCEIGRAK